ncbi:MAG: DUF5050 domain-containing protein [Prolixibacteraceae bacterium]
MKAKIIANKIGIIAISTVWLIYLNGCGGPIMSEKEEEAAYWEHLKPVDPTVPNGNIVFTRSVTGGTDIFLYGTPTDDGHNLTNLGSGRNEQPAISPDNTKIAFVSRRDGNAEIYVMNLDGTSVKRLTNNSAWDLHPAWSPDGTKLAFVSTRNGVRNIYSMAAADGANVTRITSNTRNDDSPSWSPDGMEIVYSSEMGSSLESPVPRLFKIKIDGTGQMMLSKTSTEHEIEPSWSALNIIAYTRSSVADGAQIYTMKPDGSQVTKLTSDAGGWHPNWSDGGATIAFVSDRTSTIRVFTMLSSGTNILQLVTKTAMEFEPDWGTSTPAPK